MRSGGISGWMLALTLALLVTARDGAAAGVAGWVVSLDAGVSRGYPREQWYGVVSVSLPLDRDDGATASKRSAADAHEDDAFGIDVRPERHFGPDEPFLGQPPAAGASDDDPPPAPRVTEQPPSDGTAPADGAPNPPSKAETPRATPKPSPARRLRPAFIRQVVREALRVRGVGAADTRLDSMARRARASALLPEVRLRGARTTGESLRLSPTVDDPYRYVRGGDDELIMEARLSWRLDRLLFADEELGVERLRRQDRAECAELSIKVLATLFRWHRSRLRADNADLLPEERADAELDALEAAATLDVMTDGWFSGAAAE